MAIPNLQRIVLERLADLRLRPIPAAREAGLERNFLSDILKGRKDDLRGDNLVKLAAVLKLDPGQLAQGRAVASDGGPPIGEPISQTTAPITQRSATERRDQVPVRGTAAGALAGRFRFTGKIVEHVARPPGLATATGIYALFVNGDSVAPEHKHGELRFISPDRPYRPGDSVVVLQQVKEGAPPEAFLGVFVEEDSKRVVLHKWKPLNRGGAKVEFVRSTVAEVHKVLTMNELFGV